MSFNRRYMKSVSFALVSPDEGLEHYNLVEMRVTKNEKRRISLLTLSLEALTLK